MGGGGGGIAGDVVALRVPCATGPKAQNPWCMEPDCLRLHHPMVHIPFQQLSDEILQNNKHPATNKLVHLELR